MVFNDFPLGIFASYCLSHVVNKPLETLVAYNKQHLNDMLTGWVSVKWLHRAAGFDGLHIFCGHCLGSIILANNREWKQQRGSI